MTLDFGGAISSAVGTAIIPHFTHLTSNVHAHHPTSHKLHIEFDLFSRHVRFFVLGPVSPFFRLLFVACVKSRLTHVIFSNIHEICHNMMFESSYRDRDHPYVMFTFQAVPTNIFVFKLWILFPWILSSFFRMFNVFICCESTLDIQGRRGRELISCR